MLSAPETSSTDNRWMEVALDAARRGVGLTSPNPPVGAVIVADRRQIGSGYHRGAGQPHAEIEALRAAEAGAAKAIRGATLYVTLEPCSTQGRTPPCTDAIIAAGIRRVVYGARDPNPAHAGAADRVLAAAGIEVKRGVQEAACEQLIRPFAKWITTGLPYVIAKAGQSLDGRLTRPPGESQWITSDAARAHGRRLRMRADAIIIGAETLRRDDPQLTLRDGSAGTGKEQPWRVVLTRSGELPANARLLTDVFKERTLIMRGMTFTEVLRDLGGRGVVTVLVEGGGIVLGQAFQCRQVDEVFWYIAPRFCGSGRPSIAGLPLPASVELDGARLLPIGDNVLVTGFPRWTAPADPPS